MSESCVNHPEVEAEFRITLDVGEELSYCNKCAAHLASNGFQVERVPAPTSKSPKAAFNNRDHSPSSNNQSLSRNTSAQSFRRKSELSAFLSSLSVLEEEYREKQE